VRVPPLLSYGGTLVDSRRKARKIAVRRQVFERDNFTCQICGWKPPGWKDYDGVTRLTDGKKILTIDHIRERALGGPSTMENFRAACDECNVERSIHVGKLVREGQAMGLDLTEARLRAARILAA